MPSVLNQRVEPMSVTWGEDVKQSESVTCVADVSSSLNNKYFMIYNQAGTKFYVWYNVAAAGVDPAVAGATGAVVAISANDSASTVASATKTVIDALTGLDCTNDGAVLTIVDTIAGSHKPSHDGAAATGFSFAVNLYGDSAVDLGYTDGDIEMAHEENYVDLTSHQTGTEIIGNIPTGSTVSLTVNLKETAVSQLRKIIGTAEGDVMIPSGTGASSTEVIGIGTSRQFKQTQERARKLVLHPVALPSANKSRDVTIWKAFPKVGSLTFSGENVLMIPVEFSVYADYSKHEKVRKVVFGDSSQTLT